MIKSIKKSVILGLATTLAATVIPSVNVMAETETVMNAYITEKEPSAPAVIENEDDMLGLPLRFPTVYYDKDNLGLNLPAVRDQSYWGTCWMHGAIASVEGATYYNGVGDSDINIDLSEWQALYHMRNWDGKNDLSRDSVEWINSNPTGEYSHYSSWGNVGGDEIQALRNLMTWKGVTNEVQGEYPIGEDKFNNSYPKASTQKPFEDDVYHLTGYKVFNIKENPAMVKKALFENGMLTFAYYSNTEKYTTNSDKYSCIYCDHKETPNHTVTLVGWDDEFDKDNFIGYVNKDDDSDVISQKTYGEKDEAGKAQYVKSNHPVPEKNGAWLIRNSWGNTEPMKGYYWISYEDKSIQDNVAQAFTEVSNNFNHLYQYDGTYIEDNYTFDNVSKVTIANVFPVSNNESGNEEIARVAFETLSPNLNYSIQLYGFNDKYMDKRYSPNSGCALLTAPITGYTDAIGYYSVDLPKGVIVEEGTYYSVVIELSTDSNSIIIPRESSSNCSKVDMSSFIENMAAGTYVATEKWTTDAKPGESWYLEGENGSWYDINYDKEEYTGSNLRIKSYTNDTKEKSPYEYPAEKEYKFKDVPEGKWYTDAVKYMFNAGFMAGKSETKFAPDDKCSREEFVQILANTRSIKEYKYRIPFEDVVKGKWYENAVMWAYGENIISGISSTEFGIGQNVTREQVAVLLMNYAKMDGVDTEARADLSSFKDAKDVSGWAKNAMSWANKHNIIKGAKGNKLNPQGDASRAEIAQMFCNYANEFWK